MTVGARDLYALRVSGIWSFLTTQPASYWLICIYLFFEYVRPQSMYESIAFLPWTFLVLVACLSAFVLERKWFRLRAPEVLLALFSAVVLVSSALADFPAVSFHELPLFASWVLIYLLISNIVVTEQRFLVFLLSFLLYNLKMSLHGARTWAAIGFAFRDWGVYGAPGWFTNSGEFGIEMTMFLPISILFILALRRYWGRWKLLFFAFMPVTSVLGLVASSSRGAILGGAAVMFWFLLRSRHKVRALVATALVLGAVVTIIPEQQKDRLAAIGNDPTSISRLTYWKDGIKITNDHPAFGIGYANWLTYYQTHYDPRGQLPHNIFVQASSELGYTGLFAFLLLIGYTFVTNYRTRKLARRLPGNRFLVSMAYALDGALVGYLVTGFFVTVLYYPYFWINFAMTVALRRAASEQWRRAGEAVLQPQAILRRAGGQGRVTPPRWRLGT
jgi:putative inorganic carbon (HCO3(-)) transporter